MKLSVKPLSRWFASSPTDAATAEPANQEPVAADPLGAATLEDTVRIAVDEPNGMSQVVEAIDVVLGRMDTARTNAQALALQSFERRVGLMDTTALLSDSTDRLRVEHPTWSAVEVQAAIRTGAAGRAAKKAQKRLDEAADIYAREEIALREAWVKVSRDRAYLRTLLGETLPAVAAHHGVGLETGDRIAEFTRQSHADALAEIDDFLRRFAPAELN